MNQSRWWKVTYFDGSYDLVCAADANGNPAPPIAGRSCLEWHLDDVDPIPTLTLRVPWPGEYCANCFADTDELAGGVAA